MSEIAPGDRVMWIIHREHPRNLQERVVFAEFVERVPPPWDVSVIIPDAKESEPEKVFVPMTVRFSHLVKVAGPKHGV